MLAQRLPNRRMAGISDPFGFTLFGTLTEAQVQGGAVSDAMLRLQAGEASLAIHPRCGTNLATSGLLVALAATFARLGGRARSHLATGTHNALRHTHAGGPTAGYLPATLHHTGTNGDRWMVGVHSQKVGPLTIGRVVLE